MKNGSFRIVALYAFNDQEERIVFSTVGAVSGVFKVPSLNGGPESRSESIAREMAGS